MPTLIDFETAFDYFNSDQYKIGDIIGKDALPAAERSILLNTILHALIFTLQHKEYDQWPHRPHPFIPGSPTSSKP